MAVGDIVSKGRITLTNVDDGRSIKKIYTRSQLQPITPVGDSPIGWSAVPSAFDAPPNYGNLWSSSATVDPNGVVQGTWSTPTIEEPYTSNALDRFPFTLGSGSQFPYSQYGTDNIREIGLNPFGVSDVIWRGKSHISTGFCGGIDTSATYYYNLDNSKKYRVSFWFKRNTWSEGSFYFGLRGTVQQSSDWTDTSNYYFASAISTFPTATTDKWYFIVGYIYPSNQIEAIVDPKSGIYDPANGNMLRAMTGTPRQKEGVYKVGIRLSQYNCPTTDPEFRLWQPRIDLCDGREPSIEQLLKGSPKTPTVTISGETVFKFSSGQTVPENTPITLSAELTNGATTYRWQYFRISDSTWVNLSSGTSQTYSLPHNSSSFQSTNRIQIRCTTVVAGATYTSNVLTITKVYDGIAGSNQAPLLLYKRAANSPAKPTNTAVWTFATASYSTAPNNGWETAIPATDGYPCWVIQAVASGNGTTDPVAPTEWSDPRLLVQDGTPGSPGLNNTVVSLYKRSSVASPEVPPAKPISGSIIYNFYSVTISGDTSGWTLEAPEFVAGTKLYKIVAAAASYDATTAIVPTAWTNPIKTEDSEAADLLRTDMTSEISRLEGQIGLRATSETVNALGLRVSSAEAGLLLVPGQISLAVSEVKIGGINLVKNSRCNNITGWDPSAQCVESVVSDAKYGDVVEIERISGADNFQKVFTIDRVKLSNTSVVYYVIAKRISATGSFYYGAWSETWNKLSSSTPDKIDLGDGWFMYWTTFNSGSTIGTGTFGINSMTGKWRFYAVGATVGNKPPATWSEYPADIAAELFSAGIDITAKLITLKGDTKIIDSLGNPVALFTNGKIIGSRIDATTINASEINTTNLVVSSGAKLGGLRIDGNALKNDPSNNQGLILLTNTLGREVAFGVDSVMPSTSGLEAVAYLKNNTVNPGYTNYALIVEAKNAASEYFNHAIAIRSGFISGIANKPVIVTSGYSIDVLDGYVLCNNTGNINLTLPGSTAWYGRFIFIKRGSTGAVTVADISGTAKIWDAGSQVVSISLGAYALAFFEWIGGVWHYNAMYR